MNKIIRTLVLAVLALTGLQATALDRVTYYHNDALGSPVAATDQSGNLLWRESYEPYGERLQYEDNGTNELWYTGKQEESEFGINYFGARWYDPTMGRFLAIDPVGFSSGNVQSFNRYAYANNNPYLYVDPDGELPILIPVIIFFAKELAGEAFERSTGLPALFSVKGAAKAAAKGLKKFAKGGAGKSGKVISKQKQAGHVPGTPQNANRKKQGKPTSSFFGEKSGERLTQTAFEKGKPVPGRPNVREHDFGVSTGTGPNGGMQTRVRVHQDKKGRIHGHPSGPQKF